MLSLNLHQRNQTTCSHASHCHCCHCCNVDLVLFHNVPCYTNSLLLHIQVSIIYLLNITCTLVALPPSESRCWASIAMIGDGTICGSLQLPMHCWGCARGWLAKSLQRVCGVWEGVFSWFRECYLWLGCECKQNRLVLAIAMLAMVVVFLDLQPLKVLQTISSRNPSIAPIPRAFVDQGNFDDDDLFCCWRLRDKCRWPREFAISWGLKLLGLVGYELMRCLQSSKPTSFWKGMVCSHYPHK